MGLSESGGATTRRNVHLRDGVHNSRPVGMSRHFDMYRSVRLALSGSPFASGNTRSGSGPPPERIIRIWRIPAMSTQQETRGADPAVKGLTNPLLVAVLWWPSFATGMLVHVPGRGRGMADPRATS